MSIRPCSRAACNEVYITDIEVDNVPFVKVWVGARGEGTFFGYCCPRCASVDLTERFSPKVLP